MPYAGGDGRDRELKTLEVVFEGKSEYYDAAGQCSATPLLSLSKGV
jgi:hypothetical protein